MILIPKENERDIEEMSSEITKGLRDSQRISYG